MLETILKKLEAWMESDEYKNYYQKEKEYQKRLNKFLNTYTKEHISNMDINEYVSGNKNKNSFCNIVENGLDFYGEIKGQTTSYQRFVVYWSEKVQAYSFGDKRTKHRKGFGSSIEEIYPNVIKNILAVIDATKEKNLKEIADNPLNPMFKNKISFLYDSESQIPIYNDEHLNAILLEFDIKFDSKADRVYKRKALYDFYVNSGIKEKVSPSLFMYFIYGLGGYRYILKGGYKVPSATDYSLEDIKFHSVITHEKKAKGKWVYNPEKDEVNRKTGKKAEDIVLDYLKKHKKELDVNDLKALCSDERYRDDSTGFDISYKHSDGTEIYVEVKATKANLKDEVRFIMSSNELEAMRKHADTYYIYFVNDVDNGKIIKRILGREIPDIEKPIKYFFDFKPDSIN